MTKFLLLWPLLVLVVSVASAADQVPRAPGAPRVSKEREPLTPLTDREVREFLVRESLLHYVGYCPCPYNTRNDGKKCSSDSGYDRTGGRLPICYPTDVTDEQIGEFRLKMRRNKDLKPGT